MRELLNYLKVIFTNGYFGDVHRALNFSVIHSLNQYDTINTIVEYQAMRMDIVKKNKQGYYYIPETLGGKMIRIQTMVMRVLKENELLNKDVENYKEKIGEYQEMISALEEKIKINKNFLKKAEKIQEKKVKNE